jgi:hypothetical protein
MIKSTETGHTIIARDNNNLISSYLATSDGLERVGDKIMIKK